MGLGLGPIASKPTESYRREGQEKYQAEEKDPAWADKIIHSLGKMSLLLPRTDRYINSHHAK